ncbi:MAG: hypothetical protein U0269_21910 [Polyangiales bacterium]
MRAVTVLLAFTIGGAGCDEAGWGLVRGDRAICPERSRPTGACGGSVTCDYWVSHSGAAIPPIPMCCQCASGEWRCDAGICILNHVDASSAADAAEAGG